MNFDKSFQRLLIHEGGYVNDPIDKGGETKYGITKRRYPAEDIKNLTLERAKYLYKRDFWDNFKIDQFPFHLRYITFDMYVNHNPKAVAKILQRSINHKARKQVIYVDGIIGPITLRKLRQYQPELSRVLAFRSKYYVDIVNRHPSQIKYLHGWLKKRVFEEYSNPIL